MKSSGKWLLTARHANIILDFKIQMWTHINPLGGWTKGRDAVIKELNEVHSTFLNGVAMKIEETDVHFPRQTLLAHTLRPMELNTRTNDK